MAGRFSSIAALKTNNSGTNQKGHYLDHATDWGEGIFVITKAPFTVTKKERKIVPVVITCLVWDADDRRNSGAGKPPYPGATRDFFVDIMGSDQRDVIQQQYFKQLMTAAARVPLAEERAVEAVNRLHEVYKIPMPKGFDLEASPNLLVAFRDSMIEQAFEVWTDGEGAALAGRPFKVAVWGRPPKEGKARPNSYDGNYTSTRFAMLSDEELAALTGLHSGDEAGIRESAKDLKVPDDALDTFVTMVRELALG